ncbi:phosphatase PAP2 family protein [Pseudomonas sp. P1B16]|jgi:membrane-associated PAP2 superfamily phosphatase|uniref:Phosphatase PAP2 family protein n=1 Tax=Pseudomonas capeferrum TaxID=1495066 RepID=A0ABY7R6G9_9PSED|nr:MULTISPECIES: phosphatase PAP2 family protein [Pseudomonas]KEY85472.1 phosphoesterase [Pseudomonas capeferrum]KGI93471.1 phosphoesterase [Pseudomonas sp. H2]MBC3500625.1 phosphatase PAP2 family protein [Pseudomonas sp. SWRI59]MBC3506388.1 phosphatase PAP2 family protein [Pseudomonas sp. SWRI68]MCH7299752.1 phosphatase PAP2 family protein [Pseudomonas capeferrum]
MHERSRPRPINLWVYLGIPLVTAVALVLLELTSVDMDVANLFFDPAAGQFIGRHSYWLENVLHDGVKQAVILLGLLALLTFALSFFWKRLFGWRRELGCLVLALSLSTAFVTPLKKVTQVQCPWSLSQFGGKETYSKLLEARPATDKPGLCWPGGHAATGFCLFALFFALRDRRPRLARVALVVAVVAGSVLSVGRMMQGAHFLSHNVWTAVFCWLIGLGSYYLVLYRRGMVEAPAAERRVA